MHEYAIIALAGIGLLAIACQWIAWWLKLPAILFLLLAGILAGPVTGWLDPGHLFGELFFPLVSLSVAVILFEGSLTLRFREIIGLEHVVRRMVSTGVLITWAVISIATHFILHFSWEIALLFGSLAVVTGPTVIVPMLRTVRPNIHLANILRWEGIVIDPIGALLAVLVFQYIVSGSSGGAFGKTALTFAASLGSGLLVGSSAGYLLGIILRRYWLPEYLHNLATLTLVFAVYAVANLLQAESGLLAVTVMGILLANMKDVEVADILDFKESLSILLISGLFIILAARIDFNTVAQLGWKAVGVFLVIQFVARPLKIAVATWGSSLKWQERMLLAWIAPRGIVAAAVAAVFSIRLQEQGFEQAVLLVPLIFLVIIGTVVLQSATARVLAVRLGGAEPEPRGFLIVGANPVARAVARALNKQGFPTLLADNNWDNIRAALMDGHETFFGSIVSEHADRHLDLVGIGNLLALSPQREANTLAAMRYRSEFGDANIYTLRTSRGKQDEQVAKPDKGQVAFGRDVNFDRMSELLRQGAEIKATKLTDTFDFDEYYKQYYGKSILLFAIDPRGNLHVYTPGEKISPMDGWTMLSLILKDTGDKPEKREPDDAQDEEPGEDSLK